jgi:transcription-repair coupling factor (superfamily II helicase)
MLFSSSHSRPRYTQLIGSSDALALAQYSAQHSPLAVIAANALEAQRLVEEIPFFNPSLRVHLLPDWETLPYDHFSPHQDLISERLATLHHIRSIGQQTARPSPQSSPASGRGSERENQSLIPAGDVIVVPLTTDLPIVF